MDKESLKNLSNLARIDITEEEEKELLGSFEEILDYVGEIQQLTTEEKPISPGFHRNIFRDDEPTHEKGTFTESLLQSVPEEHKKGSYVKVKKIIQND